MYRFGFIIEQALGHITHGKNLQVAVPKDPQVEADWGLIPYAIPNWARFVPVYKNWTLRSGIRARRVLAQMQQRGPLDAVLFHTQVPAALALDWLDRIPGLISLDATPRQYDRLGAFYNHSTGPALFEDLKFRLARTSFRKARALVTWSEWARQSLIDEYGVAPEKITVIPPGVNPQLWKRPAPYQPNPKRVRILFVGGDLERKGGLLLLETFRLLQAEGLPLELQLVTRDSIKREEGLQVFHNVEPNSPFLVDLYQHSDIFCLPTYGDCLPLVLQEAAAAGTPLISTRVAGIPEVVRDGETGLLVEPGDLGSLVNAVRRLATDTGLRQRMGAAAEQMVVKELDAGQNAFRLLELMKRVSEEAAAINQPASQHNHKQRRAEPNHPAESADEKPIFPSNTPV